VILVRLVRNDLHPVSLFRCAPDRFLGGMGVSIRTVWSVARGFGDERWRNAASENRSSPSTEMQADVDKVVSFLIFLGVRKRLAD
jgi:hypothetical protein